MKTYSTYMMSILFLLLSTAAFAEEDEKEPKKKDPVKVIEKVDSIEVKDVSTEDTLVFGDYEDDEMIVKEDPTVDKSHCTESFSDAQLAMLPTRPVEQSGKDKFSQIPKNEVRTVKIECLATRKVKVDPNVFSETTTEPDPVRHGVACLVVISQYSCGGPTRTYRKCSADCPTHLKKYEDPAGKTLLSEPELNVYPNPARSGQDIHIDLSNTEGEMDVTMINMLGANTSVKTNNGTISTDGLAAGQYIIAVKSQGETYTKRIILR